MSRDTLLAKTVKELRRLAVLVGFKGAGKLQKEPLADALAAYTVANPDKLAALDAEDGDGGSSGPSGSSEDLEAQAVAPVAIGDAEIHAGIRQSMGFGVVRPAPKPRRERVESVYAPAPAYVAPAKPKSAGPPVATPVYRPVFRTRIGDGGAPRTAILPDGFVQFQFAKRAQRMAKCRRAATVADRNGDAVKARRMVRRMRRAWELAIKLANRWGFAANEIARRMPDPLPGSPWSAAEDRKRAKAERRMARRRAERQEAARAIQRANAGIPAPF